MNPLEREFLEASLELSRQREAEREAARQQEIETLQKLAAAERQRAEEQTRSSRRLRWLAAGLGLLLLVTGAASFVLSDTLFGESDLAAYAVFIGLILLLVGLLLALIGIVQVLIQWIARKAGRRT